MNKIIYIGFMLIILSIKSVNAQDYIPHNHVYYIQSALNYGKNSFGCWDIRGKDLSFKNGQNLIVWQLSDKQADRKFKLSYIQESGAKYWYIISPEYTKGWGRIDVAGCGNSNGTNIQVYERNNSSAQKFWFKHLGNGRFKIYNVNGKVLCLDYQKSDNGTNIHLWDDQNVRSTEWYLIDVNTNQAYIPAPKVAPKKREEELSHKKPSGQVLDAETNKPITNATITVYDRSIPEFVPYTKNVDNNGEHTFYDLPEFEQRYYMIASAPGYGSKRIDVWCNRKNIKQTFKLNKTGSYKAVEVKNNGVWLYEKIGENYYYIDGEVKPSSDKFFNDNNNRSEKVQALMAKIGIDGTPANTDEEIRVQFKKVFDFWRDNKVECMGTITNPTHKAAKAKLYDDGDEFWPSVQEYADVFDTYNCLPSMNCSAVTLQLANLLTLTGIPRDKMAIEVMYSNNFANGEHWAILLYIKNQWLWIDPYKTFQPFPISLETLESNPTYLEHQYNTPYKIYMFPEAKNLKVPLCSKN